MTALLLTSLWLGTAHASLGCEETSNREQLYRSVDIARQAFAEQDQPVFDAALQETEFLVHCMREPLNDRDAALLHLVQGLAVWNAEAPELALPYFQLFAEAFRPTSEEANSGVPDSLTKAEVAIFRQVLPQLRDAEIPKAAELPPAVRGRLQVNGQGAELYALTEHPYLVQVTTSSRVLANFYVHPGDDLPSYPRLRTMLLLGSGGVAVAAAGSLVKGWLVAEDLRQWTPEKGYPPRFQSEQAFVESRQTRNHVYVLTGAGLGGVALAGLVGVGITFVR